MAQSKEPIFDLTALASSLVDSSGLPAVAGLSDGALGAEQCPEKWWILGKNHMLVKVINDQTPIL